MEICGIRIASWIPKATNTHSEHVILIAFSAAKLVTRTRLNVKFIRTLTVSLCVSVKQVRCTKIRGREVDTAVIRSHVSVSRFFY
jgi:hypothetical protein